jgi:RNA polymerase sigma factor (sigma-70 family)
MATTSAPRPVDVIRRPRRALRFTRDDELVRLVRRGDEAAFEAIYDRHHRGILAFSRHMLGSREEGEDAVQHTFAAAYRELVDTDKPIHLKAWLYAIARNRCLSLLRARREQVSLDDAEPATDGLAAEVQRRQDLRDMLADLQRLPEDQRAALVLSELGALSHEEIAVSLGVRKDKVKALVFQARESLAASRQARETDCREIQEQLAVLRGGALRRSSIRRHVDQCAACQEFKAEVQRQRSAMAILLPVLPTMGLREGIMAAILGGGGAAGGGALIAGGGAAAGGGILAASGAKSLAAKVLSIAAAAGAATGGGLAAIDKLSDAPADPRDPLALAPPEKSTVELVRDLRQRADDTARKRVADYKAAAAGGAVTVADERDGGDRGRVAVRRSVRAPAYRRGRPDRRERSADRSPRSSVPAVQRVDGAPEPAAPAPQTPARIDGLPPIYVRPTDVGSRRTKQSPPEHERKGDGWVPPGLRKKGGLPPGQAKKGTGWVPPGLARKDEQSPGHAKKQDAPEPRREARLRLPKLPGLPVPVRRPQGRFRQGIVAPPSQRGPGAVPPHGVAHGRPETILGERPEHVVPPETRPSVQD